MQIKWNYEPPTPERQLAAKELAEKILGVEVPTESVMEVKDGKKKVVDRKMCPGYVIVHMELWP